MFAHEFKYSFFRKIKANALHILQYVDETALLQVLWTLCIVFVRDSVDKVLVKDCCISADRIKTKHGNLNFSFQSMN